MMLSKLESVPAQCREPTRNDFPHPNEYSRLRRIIVSWSKHRRVRQAGAYVLAIAAVAVACLITIPLRYFASGMPNQFFFFTAVVFSAWFCGAGPGFLSAILSTVAVDYFLLRPLYPIDAFGPQDLLWSLSFLACCLFAYKVSLQRRRVEEALKQARAELEERVRIRSSELETANKWAISQIVERARAEVALGEAQSDLLRFSRIITLGETTAAIAHEINQPLAAIAANANAAQNWLNRAPPNIEEVRTSVTEIAVAAERAGDVIGRVRSLMKRSRPQFEQIDVNEIVDNVLALAEAMLLERGITVTKTLGAKNPFVRGDSIQLQQLILNLINNAAEAMTSVTDRSRGLKIKTGNEGDQTVVIRIIDSGDGIDPGRIDQLFTPFYTTRQNGMGMGLAICRTIVENHGGRISATSPSPYGTEFCVNLPIVRQK
jgi:C4-dicarboxylate-specific signal transduction histidine kinase